MVLEQCDMLNPATLLPERLQPKEKVIHSCLEVTGLRPAIPPTLKEEPLRNLDLLLFCDRSSSYEKGQRVAGYAVAMQHIGLEAGSPRGQFGAQAAELIALTRACIIATNKTANIDMDSK